MKQILLPLILTISFLWTACDNTTVDNAANFKFETIDKEKNTLNLIGTIRYRLKARLQNKLSKKYGRQQYKDSILVPVISSISRKVLSDYSADEIYNYKRDEIVQKLDEQSRTAFAEMEIEVTNFSIWSVELPDTLMSRFEKAHVVRFQNAINKCSRNTQGVVTKIDGLRNGDSLVFYEFMIENKKYEGILSPDEDTTRVSVGDTLIIEYACEDPVFHRLKK
jgi:hypothetical protein